MEPAAIAAAFTSIRAATELVKAMREAGLSLEKAEAKAKLADLMSVLADVKMDMATIQETLLERDAEIRVLKGKLETRASVVFEPPVYYTETDGVRDGPFCQPCFDKDAKLIRLQGINDGHWECNVCKTVSNEKRFIDAQKARIDARRAEINAHNSASEF